MVRRWTVVAACVAAVAGGTLAPVSAHASSTAWYQTYQAGVAGSFFQTAAVNQNNIWSVGVTYTATGKIIPKPFVRHFNGSSWQAVTIPGATGFMTEWVSASSANNVWVGGLGSSRTDTTVVYRWNGARWTKIPVPALTVLGDVTVLAPNNVWAFGTSGTVGYDVFHWNGTRWQYYLSNALNFVPQGLSASAPNNIWVSGYAVSGRKQVLAAYRWNGKAWRAVSMPHPAFNNGGPYVTALTPSNVWIGWFDDTATHALHWDGRRWQTLTPPYYADPAHVLPDGRGGYWFGAGAILTGSTWELEQVPSFTGGYGSPIRIPGTTSFLLTAGAATGGSTIIKPTLFRFDR